MMLLVVIGTMGFAACSSVDCALEKKVECRVRLLDAEGNDISFGGYLTVCIADPTSETVKDTLLNRLENAKTFSFPLSYADDTDKVNFCFSDKSEVYTVIDAISIEKTNEPVFESVDCAPRFNHTIKSVECTENMIDSVVVNDKTVDNDASKVHLHVYMHTDD